MSIRESLLETKKELLSDPFTARTLAVRRNLLIMSVVTIIIAITRTNIDTIILFKITTEIPSQIVQGALGLFIIFQIMTYIILLWNNYSIWGITPITLEFGILNTSISENVTSVESLLRRYKSRNEEFTNFNEEFEEKYQRIKLESELAREEYEKNGDDDKSVNFKQKVYELEQKREKLFYSSKLLELEKKQKAKSVNLMSSLENKTINAINEFTNDFQNINKNRELINEQVSQVKKINYIKYFWVDVAMPMIIAFIALLLTIKDISPLVKYIVKQMS